MRTLKIEMKTTDRNNRILIIIFLLFLLSNNLFAQGIRGNIYDENQEPLPFSTIYVRNIESGSTSNAEGFYEMKLAPGRYDLIFQFLGYESLIKVVEVGEGFKQIDVNLKPQALVLQSVVISARQEDPALTIMRKAIAAAKYHTNQLDEYSSKVYIKGSGRLINAPFLLRKRIAKEGIDSTAAFTSESIVEINYKRPNQINERVVSIRTSGEDNNTSPTPFINGSFYESEIAEAISPLSRKAFVYYKFVYKGTFIDRGYSVSKIQVIPRSKGDDLFYGHLSIIEDEWSIHSLDLKTTKFGIKFRIKQIYDPIEDKVWLPISHKFDVEGNFLGFKFQYDYLATISDYKITLNPDLITELEIIDEKVDKEIAKEVSLAGKGGKEKTTLEKLQTKEKITRRDLRKLLRDYEKEELEEGLEEDVIAINNRVIDSTAYNNDSTFWAKIRPVPLSVYEKKGYQVTDSLTAKYEREAKGDTLKIGRRDGLHFGDFILGNTYRIGDKTHLKINNALLSLGFNTVEGFHASYGLQFTKTFENKHWLSIEPTARYALSREKLIGDIKLKWKLPKNGLFTVSGGKNINQYNSGNPILPIINTFSSLLSERNFMKIYESNYFSVKYQSKISDKFSYGVDFTWADRNELFNNTDFSLIDVDGREYTANAPINDELNDTQFNSSQARTINLSAEYIPFVKYTIRNQKKIALTDKSPVINVSYKSTLGSSGEGVDFSLLDVGVKHSFKTGANGKLSYKLNAGTFLNDNRLTFIDFKHFQGNQFFFQSTDPVESYRLLDYYQHSTAKSYFSSFVHYNFRKLLLTRLPFVQDRGLKEALFVNYLGTSSSQNYTELGYSINNIFRFFRVEGIAVFRDGQYYDWGFRVGISTNIADFISVN